MIPAGPVTRTLLAAVPCGLRRRHGHLPSSDRWRPHCRTGLPHPRSRAATCSRPGAAVLPSNGLYRGQGVAGFVTLAADGPDEVADDVVAVGREDRFRVELQAFGRVPCVAQAHGDPARAPGGDQQVWGQGVLLDDQGVVARGAEAPGQPGQDAAAVVGDQ